MANIPVLHLATSGCRCISSQRFKAQAHAAFRGKVDRLAVINKNPGRATAGAGQHKFDAVVLLGLLGLLGLRQLGAYNA